jgi:ABC-2 type transport system ATP-binding protein
MANRSTNTVLHCEGLTKRFGRTVALDGLDLEVSAGEVHGFLGPNGAGKTVTMRILLGLLRPDAGTVTLLGGDPWADAVLLHHRIAYVPGETTLWPNLTGGEILDLLADLHRHTDLQRRNELIDSFDLDPRKKARTYSKGNRQKVALIAALATNADLLILDEPTAGLDPLMEQVFREQIALARGAGRSVLLSSHLLAEVERICDRVTIIRDGRTVESGTLTELRHLRRTTINVSLDTLPQDLGSVPGIHDLHINGEFIVFDVDGEHLASVVKRLTDHGIRSLTSHPPTLEDLFMRHYGDRINSSTSTL